MHKSDTGLIFSATDLSNFLVCPHLTLLDRAAALGLGPRPPVFDDPGTEVLKKRGLEHEAAYLARLQAEGLEITEIGAPGEMRSSERWPHLAAATLEAMRAGVDVVYQACLFDGTWLGRPDFLRRVDAPSDLGDWSYEIVDTKLAREAKGGAVLQLCSYADLLTPVQGLAPTGLHLVLGGPTPKTDTFRYPDFAAYYRSVKARFHEWIEAGPEPPAGPDPVEHCGICKWGPRCDPERREIDHLSLVAGITRGQRSEFGGRGVATVVALSGVPLPIDPPLERGSAVSAVKVREQARIQIEGRVHGAPRYELLDGGVEGEGLAALPPPSAGDIFFDIEGDPYAFGEGLEYLLGFVDNESQYTSFRALDRAQERAAFEAFMDFVAARLEAHPNLHIYHYHHYEPTHLKQLMGRHATREDALDGLLRGGVFVDLHRVVRQGLRASVESYSIKKLEPFYGYAREVDLRNANHALSHFEAWLELGGEAGGERALFEMIEGYNRDDCRSTLRLRNWLEGLREELAAATGTPVPRPAPGDPEPSEEFTEARAQVMELMERLTAEVPADPEAHTDDERARWILAQLLDYHRREDKSTWWEYFRCLELSAEEMIEDGATLGGLEYVGMVDEIKRSYVHRYSFPPQDHRIKVERDARDAATESSSGTIVAIDDFRGTIDIKRAKNSDKPHPAALVPLDFVSAKEIHLSLVRLAEATLDHGWGDEHPFPAAVDLLLKRPPRAGQASGADLMEQGEDTLTAASRLVERFDRTVLPVQGPPGSGKTYTGAHMILALLGTPGLRVGVTGPSHKVISNLLDTVCKEARRMGTAIAALQRCDEEDKCGSDEVTSTKDNGKVREALASGEVRLAGGTAWLWSRPEFAGAVDVLFVDEAGQYTLANALAVCPAATSVVLLGDPQQLEQPQQGVHPPGVGVSALEHLVAGHATMPPDRGLFLKDTWRLHPEICDFTSEVFYEDRLAARPGLERQAVRGPVPLQGSGLRLVGVEHEGNQSESPEEVAAIAALLEGAIGGGATWIDQDGRERPLRWADVLVVAPYNAQVSALKEALPDGARVGTVDKFQGQEAPIVVYSMTSSSADDAPRGMGFLYSGSRLNVATSRARCLTVVVASPAVFAPECRTPQQMRMANAFCRYRELAGGGSSVNTLY